MGKLATTDRRCFRGVGLLCSSDVRESEHPLTQSSDVMILQVLHCPHCQGTDIIRHGTTRQGKHRYRGQEHACKERTFLLDYTYAGHAAGVKQPIIDMAMNASGIRDTARVLHVSPTTVIKELKKKAPELQPVHHAVLTVVHPKHVEVEIWRSDELE